VIAPLLEQTFNNFNNLRVLILGDVMIDGYLWGKVERISPEAPVPIVSVTKIENRLGGAANVALNISALGATPVICSVVGDDEKGKLFDQLLSENNLSSAGIVKSPHRPTTVKTRVISSGQHLLRVDEEKITPLNSQENKMLLQRFEELVKAEAFDVVIFQDYNKGVLTPQVIEKVIARCNELNIPSAVDPKKDNFLAYKNVSLFKPNLKELREGLKVDINGNIIDSVKAAVHQLEAILKNKISLVTLSEYGVVVNQNGNFTHIPAHDRKIIDVSGAGDTVISVAALCLALDLEPEILANLSNLAGGMVCEKVGVVPIDKDQFFNEACLLNPA
jgi:D-glycero-beta-D-manno-heptose-7-phosphate kinase